MEEGMNGLIDLQSTSKPFPCKKFILNGVSWFVFSFSFFVSFLDFIVFLTSISDSLLFFQWDYSSEFEALKTALQKEFPGIVVEGNKQKPRGGAFEVTTEDGTLLFSKLETDRFPSNEEVIEKLKSK